MDAQHTYNLIIAEDEDVERRAIQLLVRRRLPNVKLVGSVMTTTELLVRIHQAKPHLLILDSRLPGGAGLTITLNLVLRQQPLLKVIILADYGEEMLMRHCIRYGAFAYLTRPAQPQRLLGVLNRAIAVLDSLEAI
jgi:DNA-binding NarL/FixJ family response regulator